MIKSQKNYNFFNNTYEVGEKILINNNIKIIDETLKKITKK